jgi:hypothetical protein
MRMTVPKMIAAARKMHAGCGGLMKWKGDRRPIESRALAA